MRNGTDEIGNGNASNVEYIDMPFERNVIASTTILQRISANIIVYEIAEKYFSLLLVPGYVSNVERQANNKRRVEDRKRKDKFD